MKTSQRGSAGIERLAAEGICVGYDEVAILDHLDFAVPNELQRLLQNADAELATFNVTSRVKFP